MKNTAYAKRITAFLTAVFVLNSLFLWGHSAYASGISVSAVIPENQVDTKNTYFDLRLEPGQEQTIQVVVRNGGADPVIAHIDLNCASTGRNGLIQYTVPDVSDESLKIRITDIAEVATPQINLDAKSQASVDIRLRMPEQAFDGCVLGGIVVTADKLNPDGEPEAQQNLQIANKYAYAIGLKITQNNNIVKPDMHLKAIKPGLVNYRPMVSVNLQNSEAAIIKGMHIDAQVYKQGSDEVFKQMEMPEVDMAPCSNFDAGIDWNDMPLEPDAYRLKMRAEYQDQVWEWDEEFTIDGQQANDVNANSPYVETKRPVWLYAIGGILLLALVFLAAFLLGRRQKKSVSE